MKLWVDDLRKPPSSEWLWCKTVNGAKSAILTYEQNMHDEIIIIDLDHDAGEYVKNGGDYIEILNWLEQKGIVDTGYFFHFHTMNPVGRYNMIRICNHNNWRVIK